MCGVFREGLAATFARIACLIFCDGEEHRLIDQRVKGHLSFRPHGARAGVTTRLCLALPGVTFAPLSLLPRSEKATTMFEILCLSNTRGGTSRTVLTSKRTNPRAKPSHLSNTSQHRWHPELRRQKKQGTNRSNPPHHLSNQLTKASQPRPSLRQPKAEYWPRIALPRVSSSAFPVKMSSRFLSSSSSESKMSESKTSVETCSICFEAISDEDVVQMPCCGRSSSSMLYCFPCVDLISQNGIKNGLNGSIGRCPTCRRNYSVLGRTVSVLSGPLGRCSLCSHRREIVDETRALCSACLLGLSFAFSYECERCLKVQRIPHPMWMYQPSPVAFGTEKWACHGGCDDYTTWRIVKEELQRIPMDHVPDEWNLRDHFQTHIREMRRQMRLRRWSVGHGAKTKAPPDRPGEGGAWSQCCLS